MPVENVRRMSKVNYWLPRASGFMRPFRFRHSKSRVDAFRIHRVTRLDEQSTPAPDHPHVPAARQRTEPAELLSRIRLVS